jgi:hypothetical protein
MSARRSETSGSRAFPVISSHLNTPKEYTSARSLRLVDCFELKISGASQRRFYTWSGLRSSFSVLSFFLSRCCPSLLVRTLSLSSLLALLNFFLILLLIFQLLEAVPPMKLLLD